MISLCHNKIQVVEDKTPQSCLKDQLSSTEGGTNKIHIEDDSRLGFHQPSPYGNLF